MDKAVYMKDTWSKQLLEALAEDYAVEDTMEALDKATFVLSAY